MDEDDYPEEHELKLIAEWPHDDWAALLEYVRERWTYQDRWTVGGDKLFVSTGGWSGNEDLIRALQQNRVFWAICWEQSRRGGHHILALDRVKGVRGGE